MKNKDYFQQEDSNSLRRNYELFESDREPLLQNIKRTLYGTNEEKRPKYYTRKKQSEDEDSLSAMRPTKIIYNSLLASHPFFDKNSPLNYSKDNSSQNYTKSSGSQGYLERTATMPSYASAPGTNYSSSNYSASSRIKSFPKASSENLKKAA